MQIFTAGNLGVSSFQFEILTFSNGLFEISGIEISYQQNVARLSNPGNSLYLFWDGEFTWPELKGDVGDLQIGDKVRSRIESPGYA